MAARVPLYHQESATNQRFGERTKAITLKTKTMLNEFSWTIYFELIIFLAAIWYIFVLFRYYRRDAHRIFIKRPAAGLPPIPEVLRYPAVEPIEEIHYPPAGAMDYDAPDQLQDKGFAEAEQFISQLKACIKNASGKPFAPAILIPQIKKLFREHPELIRSPQRAVINELIVQECESTGTALFTEDEVDEWWTE